MSKDDLERMDNMVEHDIDYSDIPPLTDTQLAAMQPLHEVLPQTAPKKVRITIRLDAHTVQWFKAQVQQAGGGSYQNLINQALRDYIERQNESLEDVLRQVLREELGEIKERLIQPAV